MTQTLHPKDHGEEVALFRAQVLGPVLNRDLERGELLLELRALSCRRFRPPGSDTTRRFAVPTLLRWRRRYQKGGLEALRPASRQKGDALAITAEQRKLMLAIRRQHPSVPANVILATLEGDGRIEPGQISAQTLRRLFRRHELSRRPRNKPQRADGARRRWEAGFVGELWHADVCHGQALCVGDQRIPVRIHALLDDKSRYLVALRVFPHERETAMLDLLLEAVRLFGAPRRLYLDNGSTYRGDALSTACGRLGVQLLHAGPRDPEARGKMERFWRTLRQGCLDHIGAQPSLHAVNVRLLAFVTERYHKEPHAGLLGRAPAKVWAERVTLPAFGSHQPPSPNAERGLMMRSEEELLVAMTVREPRRVRADCTLTVGNIDWELEEGFLAGLNVTVARTLADPQRPPWVEHHDRFYVLRPVNPVANGRRRQRRKLKPGVDAVDFDPTDVLLDRMMRRPPRYRPTPPADGGAS
jgi:transposase InsO family protein